MVPKLYLNFAKLHKKSEYIHYACERQYDADKTTYPYNLKDHHWICVRTKNSLEATYCRALKLKWNSHFSSCVNVNTLN
jgi:hypothetical protein